MSSPEGGVGRSRAFSSIAAGIGGVQINPMISRPMRATISARRAGRYAAAAGIGALAVSVAAYCALQIAMQRLGPLPTKTLGALLPASAEPAPPDIVATKLPADPHSVDPRYLQMLFTFEDRRFYSHFGIDPVGVIRAVRDIASNQRIVTGGSTLTMQVARLIDNQYRRTPSVKLRQIVRAIQLEQRFSKNEILSIYLALAPFGGRTKGVRAASLKYFGKEPRHLSIAEAALLVALPQAPEARRLDRHANAARRARNFVLDTVAAAGVITEREAELAKLQPLTPESPTMPPSPVPKPSTIKVASASAIAGLTLGINLFTGVAAAAPLEPEAAQSLPQMQSAPPDTHLESLPPETQLQPQPEEASLQSAVNEEPAEASAPRFIGTGEQIVLDVRNKLLKPQPAGTHQDDRDALWMFYASRDEPVWVSKAGWNAKAQATIDEIMRAGDWGLNADDFEIPYLPSPAYGRSLSQDQLADAEAGLSRAVLKYAREARGGRIADPATQLSSYLDRKPQIRAPFLVIAEMAASDAPDALLRKLQPQSEQFARLRDVYLAQRDGATTAPVEIPSGSKLRPGAKDADIALIRERLHVPANGVEDTVYDDALVDAVKAFQEKRGIEPANGTITSKTRRAMNERQKVELKTLLANMEEWRWMPDNLGETYVWVNIPEFKVRVIKDGKVIHTERVITGELDKQTPIFSEDLKTIYFNPRWNVPDSIKVNEIGPALARGRRRDMVVMRNGKRIKPGSVNWYKADIRNYDVYQPSGPGNALGVVKFTFPNKHAVYLHDTPNKGLFSSSERAFSHGCVRVRNPQRLAEVLLEADKGWTSADIAKLIKVKGEPEETAVDLNEHIPVHITYFTAQVDENGDVTTQKDIYGHEKRITQALDGKWNAINKGDDHLAQVELSKRLDESDETKRRKTARRSGGGGGKRVVTRSRGGGGGGYGGGSTRVSSSGSSANDIFRRSFGN
ncbi:L,D-transpeptidase YcbB [Hyphomicrobium sp. 1Nfss2.1]|uniref:L,D-transpeptidase family protein n=1 Tax=Hyphomicrobium sp. 1Nfss2.1 TaxID=3413936 RepID=UPI003C7E62B8